MSLKRDGLGFTIFLGAMTAMPPISIDMGLPGLPAIEATFADAAGRGPLTLSLFLAGFSIAPLVGGPLADRFGRRPVLIGGLALFTLAAAACAMASSFGVLLAVRLVQGLGAGTCIALPLAIIRDLFSGRIARHRLSQVTAVVGIGPMAAPVLGGWIMTFASWRTIYAAQAIAGLVLCLWAAIAFAETLPPTQRRSLQPRQLLASYRMVLADRRFRAFAAFYAAGFAALFAFVAGSPAVFMGTLGLPSHVFAILFALSACGIMLGSLVSARLSRRAVPTRHILIAGLGLTMLGAWGNFALVAAGVTTAATIVTFAALVIFAFGMTAPSANHEALYGLAPVAGIASGVLRCVQMLVAAGASAALTILEPLGHPALVMTSLMAGAALVAALLFAALLAREQRQPNSMFQAPSGTI